MVQVVVMFNNCTSIIVQYTIVCIRLMYWIHVHLYLEYNYVLLVITVHIRSVYSYSLYDSTV